MPSKYHNKKTIVDGMTFDSMAEAERYGILLHHELAGEIFGWDILADHRTSIAGARQQRIPLCVHGKKVTTYVADFVYKNTAGLLFVEDYKGFKTDTYKLKAKLFEACMGFPITEITRLRKKRALA
jgi:hypothetical protein